MALALLSAVQHALQEVLSTIGAMGLFIAAMMLIPKLRAGSAVPTPRPATA